MCVPCLFKSTVFPLINAHAVVSAHGHPRGKEIPPLIKHPNLLFTSLQTVGTQEKCNDVDIINKDDLEDDDIIDTV